MKTDVEVSITGLPFDQKAVTGFTFTYGINSIPTATLDLDASVAEAFLCNPDQHKSRSKPVSISVKSVSGCIQFDGFFDGLSMSQSVGGIAYTATFKNKFQRLLEIYPRLIGVMPSSFSIFKEVDDLLIQKGRPNEAWAATAVGNSFGAATNASVAEYLFRRIQLIVATQLDYKKVININKETNKLWNLMENAYKENLAAASSLLGKFDLDYVKDCEIRGTVCADAISRMTLGEHADLWSLMLQCYSALGCCIIVGNNKATVIPQAQFLKLDHPIPPYQWSGNEINCANPSQYSNFSMNDSSFVNIKACYVAADTSVLPPFVNKFASLITAKMGVYPKEGQDSEIPDDGATGILIVNESPFFLSGIAYGYTLNDQQGPGATFGKVVEEPSGGSDSPKEKYDTTVKSAAESMDKFKELMDKYAKLKFLQAKYSERTGQLGTYFNPRWVPGTTGSLYTRLPGTFKQFYVTNVHHRIVLSAPNSGSASTSVSFCSLRQGFPSSAVPGVSSDDLFKFSTGKMKQFQAGWVSDISS